jgi:glycosyltransferase involved in cell wall biosynthesis
MGKINTLLQFARSGVSRLNQSYVLRYPNVRAGKFRPFFHWLFVGIFRGYRYFPKIRPFIDNSSIGVRFGNPLSPVAHQSTSTPLEPLTPKVPKYIIDYIYDFSKYEPAVLSPGRKTLPWLRVVDPSDVQQTTGFDISRIESLQKNPQTIILVPHFVIGGADQYTANLVKGLQALGLGPIQVIATLPHAEFDEKKLSKEIVNAYGESEIVLWKDVATFSSENPFYLALYLHGIGAKRIINIQSELGFKALSVYGKALSSQSKLFAAYFTADVSAFAGLYSVRYFRKLSKMVTSFTDNETTADQLKELDNLASVLVLPTEVSMTPHVSKKYKSGKSEPQRFVWISRLDYFKGTRVLGHLADLMPDIQIDVFGPFEGTSLSDLGLEKPNISYGGVIESISHHNFGNYDGFIFTSSFEGNPLIVLEMAVAGLPIISTNVGNLPRDFSNGEILFVNRQASEESQAKEFSNHIKSLRRLSIPELDGLTERARKKVMEVHSEENNRKRIRGVFGNES